MPTTPADRPAEVAMRLGHPQWDAAALADAVLPVLPAPPAPADRAAVLREAAEAVDNTEFPDEYVDLFDNGARWASRLLRRLADDAAAGVQPPTTTEADPEPLTEEQVIRQHVTTVHLIGDQLADVESWLWQRLADARDTTPPAAPAAPEEPK
ncbi:hypothetical protein [Streptomyces bacillaris]|uniref:hypothetical protein n=1 Tax=Streptomyces bacillaris TaxID=68179 RepID=UPI00381EC2AB